MGVDIIINTSIIQGNKGFSLKKDGDFMSNTEETYRRQPLPDYEEVFEKLSSEDDTKKVPMKVMREIYRGNWFKIFFNTMIHIADGCGDWILPLATATLTPFS